MVNGVPTITYDLSLLKQEWGTYVSANSTLSVTFSDVEIYQQGSLYFLRGKNADNSIKSRLQLVLVNNDFYEVQALGGTKTVSCSGCQAGCSVQGDATTSWCSDCMYPWNSSDCKKTETVTYGMSAIGGERN